jgi:cytochrome c peroxidase
VTPSQLPSAFTVTESSDLTVLDQQTLTNDQKKGAWLFFGSAGCVACHKVSGQSNEMFSDFSQRVVGVPQIAPAAGDPAAGNVTFDGPGQNEDFGLEQIIGDVNDRYKFRTSPQN